MEALNVDACLENPGLEKKWIEAKIKWKFQKFYFILNMK